MPTIGKGVEEIRIWTGVAYRIFYVARFEEAVYVLHAFQKKTHSYLKAGCGTRDEALSGNGSV